MDKAPSILLKMPNWIGDCVMATPAVARLRRQYPESRIDALVRRGPAGVLIDNPDLSSVITADDRRLSSAEWAGLRDARYDAVALFPNSLRSAWLAWRLGIPRRAGFARPWTRRLLLTRAIAYDPVLWQTPTSKPLSAKSRRCSGEERDQLHMVDYYLQIADRTSSLLAPKFRSVPSHDNATFPLILPVHPSAALHVERLLESEGLSDRRLIALNPGAAYGNAKRYPLLQLAQASNDLLNRLANSGIPAALISTAAPNESHLNDELASSLGAPLHRLGEQLDLRGLTALLDRVSVLITNDSGAMHMAAARQTPTVALFGSTDWNVTRPWSPAARVLRISPECAPCFLRECPIDHRCMTSISPATVAETALDLMRERADA